VVELRYDDVLLRGLRVRYAEAGEGPPLLLVHGFLVSHKEWLPLLPLLARRFRCIAPDLPGAGASEKRGPDGFPYTREAFAETLVALLSALGIGRAHVCGHSMGGGVAIVLSADHADRVERLSLIDPDSYDFPMPWKGKVPLLPVVGPLVFKHLYQRPIFRDYFKNDVWSGHPGLDLARVDEYYEDFNALGAREAAYATFTRTVTRHGVIESRIPRVKARTLIVWGTEDRIFPVSLAHRLVREMPDASLQLLPGIAHAPNEERPEEVAELLSAHHLGGGS
jgi:pimeloyl-ACP methyl ester carboxylesterase